MKRVESVLLFLTLLFLPTQLGRHFWPQFSYIYSLPIDYLSPTMYFWDLLVILLTCVFILQQKPISKIALNLWMFFILSQLLSILPYLDQPMSLGRGLVRIEQYLISGLFGVYLASINKIKSIIFWSLALSILGESILAVLQFLRSETLGFWILGERTFSISTPAIAKFDFYGREFLRPYATFPHPNLLAAFMIIATVLVPRKITFAATALTVFLTVSRTAILAGVVSALWLLNKKLRIIFLIILAVLLPILYTRFSSAFNFDVLSLIRREEQAEIAVKLWLAQPLFGVGLNNFIPAASDQLLAGPSRFLQPVHNIFLLALAETGIFGLLGLLGLIGYPILKLLKLYPISYPLNPILLIWGIILFLGLFDHYFLTLPQGCRLLFLVWGLSLSRYAKRAMLK